MVPGRQSPVIEVNAVLDVDKVSVILCSRNEGQYIRSTVAPLGALHFRVRLK